MHDLTNTEDLLKEHSLGEMDVPKKKCVKKTKRPGVARPAQTKPVQAGIEEETQTDSGLWRFLKNDSRLPVNLGRYFRRILEGIC